jgi:hypothetical protein
LVEANVNVKQSSEEPEMPKETKRRISPALPEKAKKTNVSELDPYCMKVGDVFRAIDCEELVKAIMEQPTILAIGVAKDSPEYRRKCGLIRATCAYLQHVAPKETALLVDGFTVKRPGTGTLCGPFINLPLPELANAYVKTSDKYFGGLKPAEINLRFAAHVIVNLLVGV